MHHIVLAAGTLDPEGTKTWIEGWAMVAIIVCTLAAMIGALLKRSAAGVVTALVVGFLLAAVAKGTLVTKGGDSLENRLTNNTGTTAPPAPTP